MIFSSASGYGRFGRVAFFVPATTVGGAGLGLAILAGLPTCAFCGTFAGGGVTTGGAAGEDATCAGELVGTLPPTCACDWPA